jgi:hypothetical protein
MLDASKPRPPELVPLATSGRKTRRRTSADERSASAPSPAPVTQADDLAELRSREDEVFRMAAFRIRETANRIATLANSTRSETLKRELTAVCERLLAEEAALLARGH